MKLYASDSAVLPLKLDFISGKFPSNSCSEKLLREPEFSNYPRYKRYFEKVAGAYNYQIIRKRLFLPSLPSAFKGLKIVHISDIHAGNLKNMSAICKGVKMINEEKPDLIFFTGDFVNNSPYEMFSVADAFAKLKANMGVYAILGNHDYGDYKSQVKTNEINRNIQIIQDTYRYMGWNLLMNEGVVLNKKLQNLAIVGVENWSSVKRFPRYGDLVQAKEGIDKNICKILLTHDPSHWESKVVDIHSDIALTLSGHTHGFQFGIGFDEFKWSPAQYIHKHWKGLYRYNNQYLYVNTGFGFIGLPGRIGMPPEISVFNLMNS